ncbi:extracellular solute-binding protein [Actinomadura keratinilytica]
MGFHAPALKGVTDESSGFSTPRRRRTAVTFVSALTLFSLAACGTSSSGDQDPAPGSTADAATPLDPKTKLTLTIDCMPPAAKKAELKQWKEDVATCNKTYPNITIDGRSTPGQCLEPPRFTAMLKAKSQPDVFYAYFTDLDQVLDNDGAADISAYVTERTVPALADIDPDVMKVLKKDDKLYALPTSNYRMGLLINRGLFEKAGLDPDTPPSTWAEVREAADKIAGLGKSTAASASTARATPEAGTTPPPSTARAATSSAPTARPPSTTPPASGSRRTCTTCGGRTTAWARPSCSSGATSRSRWPPTSSACSSPPPTTSPTWCSNSAPTTPTSAWARCPGRRPPSSAATAT